MGQLVKYESEAGDILIEVKEEPDGGDDFIRVGFSEKTVTNASETLEKSLVKIQYLSNKIITSINEKNDNKPDEVNVEFGIKLGGEADFIVASGSVEANFKVSLTWKKK
jgi:hypothetical protein